MRIRLLSISYLFVILILAACEPKKKEAVETKPMSVRMAESEMARFSELWTVDHVRIPFWGYTHGIIAKAMLDMYDATGDEKYFDYVEDYADTLIQDGGFIVTYDSSKHNIDMINPGKILFPMFKLTGEEKYKLAAKTLVDAMENHPKTSEGGFWHKKRYTHQMWLDGLYMGSPFLAQYAKEFDAPELFDVVATQIELIDKYAYDENTGLYYHGWDESKSMLWADPQTGTSPNFWGRAEGWFAMALVDVLDHFPKDHPKYDMILEVLNKTAQGIKSTQDEKSGAWYQVLDQGDREGNYLEATASSMFAYSLLKAVRLGAIDESYLAVAKKGYEGILNEFIKENEDGTISLTRCCAVAGLGGKNNRDGSFDYYVNEKIRDNDPKGIGPFIWASLEYENLKE
ncbi:MAG: glycoside hydrolase family 88 protein [Cyclobacteriaceae bacterium]